MSAVTTHVLDTARGRPAQGVPVRLEAVGSGAVGSGAVGSGEVESGEAPTLIGSGTTDGDGRVTDLGPARLEAGTYRLVFDTGAHFDATGQAGFFPSVTVTFTIADPEQHYHVPLLLSPYSYSTYRGS